jgi:hypothetical protein
MIPHSQLQPIPVVRTPATPSLVTALRTLATLAPDLGARYVTLSVRPGSTYATVQCATEAALYDLWCTLARHADSCTAIGPQEYEGKSWQAGGVVVGEMEIRLSWHPEVVA